MEINNKKRNLIILRCGKNSLHKKWIDINANFDLFLLPYENFIAKTEKNCTLFPLMPGQKWPAISKFIKELSLLSNINKESLEPVVNNLIKTNDTNFKGVGQPIRIALTGSKFGPGLYDIVIALGKEEVLIRLAKIIS